MPSATAQTPTAEQTVNQSSQDLLWQDLVEWAETDLRRQVEQSLSVSSPVRPSTIIESTLFWAAANRERLLSSRSHPRNFLSGVARFIRYEKFRQVGRQRRTPPNGGAMVPLTESSQVQVQDSAWHQEIREAVSYLPEETQRLIRALYWDLCTCREYAWRTGQSEKQVQRAHAKALKKLARLIGSSQGA